MLLSVFSIFLSSIFDNWMRNKTVWLRQKCSCLTTDIRFQSILWSLLTVPDGKNAISCWGRMLQFRYMNQTNACACKKIPLSMQAEGAAESNPSNIYYKEKDKGAASHLKTRLGCVQKSPPRVIQNLKKITNCFFYFRRIASRNDEKKG